MILFLLEFPLPLFYFFLINKTFLILYSNRLQDVRIIPFKIFSPDNMIWLPYSPIISPKDSGLHIILLYSNPEVDAIIKGPLVTSSTT